MATTSNAQAGAGAVAAAATAAVTAAVTRAVSSNRSNTNSNYTSSSSSSSNDGINDCDSDGVSGSDCDRATQPCLCQALVVCPLRLVAAPAAAVAAAAGGGSELGPVDEERKILGATPRPLNAKLLLGRYILLHPLQVLQQSLRQEDRVLHNIIAHRNPFLTRDVDTTAHTSNGHQCRLGLHVDRISLSHLVRKPRVGLLDDHCNKNFAAPSNFSAGLK